MVKKAKPNGFYEEALYNNENMDWSNEERKVALTQTYKDILAERKERDKELAEQKKRADELNVLYDIVIDLLRVELDVSEKENQRAEKAEAKLKGLPEKVESLINEWYPSPVFKEKLRTLAKRMEDVE